MPEHQMCDRDERLLALWERGLGHRGWAQGDALLAGIDARALRTLGERTVTLLRLHETMFGGGADLVSHCPSCEAAVQFTVNCAAVLEQIPETTTNTVHRIDAGAYAIEFRLPVSADVVAASRESSDEGFARGMLERCVTGCARDGEPIALRDVPDDALDAVSRRMEALDPGATVSFAVDCPDCAAHWDAPLDVGQLVWQKVQASAERLLLDVDVLARAYGWTEREVLSLTPARRAAYLQIVTA
jgi:hypothetical protein